MTVSLNPFDVIRQFEAALCDYTGAKYAVAVNSCSMAILLAVACYKQVIGPTSNFNPHPGPQEELFKPIIEIPSRTYISVPKSIIHAGCKVAFREENWSGSYQLKPTPIYDSARRFTSGMFVKNTMQCCSFHWSKTLSISQAGCILHDNPYADEWLRRARFDGRREGVTPQNDDFDFIGWHCYLSPEIAAHGLVKIRLVPKHNADLLNDPYPDLSTMRIFR